MFCPKCNKFYYRKTYFNKHINLNNCIKNVKINKIENDFEKSITELLLAEINLLKNRIINLEKLYHPNPEQQNHPVQQSDQLDNSDHSDDQVNQNQKDYQDNQEHLDNSDHLNNLNNPNMLLQWGLRLLPVLWLSRFCILLYCCIL